MVNCGCCERGGKKEADIAFLQKQHKRVIEDFPNPNDSETIEGFNFQNPEALEEFERSRGK